MNNGKILIIVMGILLVLLLLQSQMIDHTGLFHHQHYKILFYKTKLANNAKKLTLYLFDAYTFITIIVLSPKLIVISDARID